MKEKQFKTTKIISSACICVFLLTILVSFAPYKYDLFLGWFLQISILFSLLCFFYNLICLFRSRTHRKVYLFLTCLFAIILYSFFGFNGRNVFELPQHRRIAWFFNVGKNTFENCVAQNTNSLGKDFKILPVNIPDVMVGGERSEDGSVDMEFYLVGGVPRQAFLYHTGASGNFLRRYNSVEKLTNYWYYVTF